MICRGFLIGLAAAWVVSAQAQQPSLQPGELLSGSKQADREEQQWRRMSAGEKLRYDTRQLFDPENFVFAAMGAAIDQARDRPGQWGQGWDAFSERYGSHLGQYFIQRTIMSSVRIVDHEDTRFFRSKKTSYQGRAVDAFLQTYWRHNDTGGMMPAYNEFLGDYGAAAASRFWWPDSYHNASSVFLAGTNTMLIDGAINVLHEFTPDIKRWLHLGR